jgi:malonate transporter and related proteins
MLDIINLALPFFGLIFLGYGFGKLSSLPEEGLAWMNFFVIYVALPALFYRIVALTPLEQLANPRYVVGTTLATFLAFALSFAIGLILLRRRVAPATIAGLAGGYGNIGYMGPGLALATLGPAAAAPVALIFCFETLLFFSLLPLMMALARPTDRGAARLILDVARKIFLHPFVIATALGVGSAALHIEPPVALDRLLQFLQNASAPCALFTLGVTVALRPFTRVPWEVPALVLIKLVVHPALALVLLTALGPFDPTWVSAAVLMAALPPALNVFVLGRQYGSWVEPASGSVLLGTLVSVGTLTTVMWLVQHGVLAQLMFR